jgi:ATP-binding cassette subfamily C protein CydD
VLLDEPTAHLDGESRAEVVTQIRDLASTGATVIVATHEQEVIDMADVVVTVTAASSHVAAASTTSPAPGEPS